MPPTLSAAEQSAILTRAVGFAPQLILICRKSDCGIVYGNATARHWLTLDTHDNLSAHGLDHYIGLSSSTLFQNEILLKAHVLGKWSGKCSLRDLWGSEFSVQATFTIHHPAPPETETYLCLQAIRESSADTTATKASPTTSDHELLHALMETVPDCIYFKDLHSRFIRVSRAMAARDGRADPGEFIGLTDFDRFTSEHARPAYDDEQRIISTGQPIIDQEEKETWPDGRVRWVSTTKLPLHDAEGQIVGTYGISRDITARKQAEEEHRQLQLQLQLAHKLESIGRLAAGIAHEINTPTQFITDNTHFLRDSFASLEAYIQATRATVKTATPALPESELDYLLAEIPKTLAQSLDGLGRVARIVRSLKEFSHPQNSHCSPVDLNHVIETAITVSRHEWKYVAEVVTHYDPALPPVPCIVDEFNQVILNLVVNAAHAIETTQKAQGKTFNPGTITISTCHDQTHAIVEIADTGGGIPEAIRERVFEPFFTTKEIGKGSGQGLAIVQTVIVGHHQGQVSFTSEVGQGTTFRLALPLTQPRSPS